MAPAENEAFSSWYTSDCTQDKSQLAHDVFEAAVHAFSTEVSKDPVKRRWLAESKHSDLQEVLAAVVGAKDQYESRKDDSGTRNVLISLSEKLHHYSAIMDVLVQHHPEYTSLAWGAMKILFVGVVNHQKLVVRLAAGLNQIADILPRAELLLQLFPNAELKRIVLEIHTQILRFLLRALGWYRESRFKHIVGSIMRPVELRYDDLLEKISTLSNSLFWISSASSQAEQRDIHTTIKQQAQQQLQHHQNSQLSLGQLAELVQQMSERSLQTNAMVLQMKDSMASAAAEQVINSSAQIKIRQQLSQIQVVQFLDQLAKTPLNDPIKVFQKASSLHKISRAKLGLKTAPFWLDAKVQEWNVSQECSLIMLKGTLDQRPHTRAFCVESISSLQEAQIPVIWALKTKAATPGTKDASGEVDTNEISTIDLIKYFISQAVSINKTMHTDATLSPWLGSYWRAKTENEWLTLLVSVLQGIPLLYLILDLDILGHSSKSQDKDFWPPACQRIFSALSARGTATVVRVVLVNYRPMLSQSPSNGLQGLIVRVGASQKEVTKMKAGRGRISGRGKMLEMRSSRRGAGRGMTGYLPV